MAIAPSRLSSFGGNSVHIIAITETALEIVSDRLDRADASDRGSRLCGHPSSPADRRR